MLIDLPVRQYCAVPGSHPRGLVTTPWTLDVERTALIELHCWNVGFPDGLPVPEEYWVYMGSPQNHERAAAVVTEVIAPVLDVGRRAGMPIIHVQPESIADRYAHLQPPRIADPPPVEAAMTAITPYDSLKHSAVVHGDGYREWEGWNHIDVAPPVRPHDTDTMISTTAQFHNWLQQRGITTLLYMGFCTNLCILGSPAAMKAMRSLEYRCVILREGTMACEFPDTLEDLTHTRLGIQYIEAWVGYSASTKDLLQACSPQ